MPWGLAGHTQGRLTPGRFIIIRQVYNPLPVLQPPPVRTWTARFQQHRRSTGLFQSCPVPVPCPSTGSASASWLQHCRNPRWHSAVLPTAGQQLPGSAPPLLLPVALPLLLQTGLVCRGKQMLCMVRIFPAAVCAGDGWSCSAELGPRWVQPSLREHPVLLRASRSPGKQEGLAGPRLAEKGQIWARGQLCLCQASGMFVLSVLLHQLLPGPSHRATLPRLPRGISSFHCCAELPSLPLRRSNPLFPAVFQPGKVRWLPVRSVLAAPASRGPRAAPAAPRSEQGTAIFSTATQDVILAASSSHRHLLPLLSLTLSFSPPPSQVIKNRARGVKFLTLWLIKSLRVPDAEPI